MSKSIIGSVAGHAQIYAASSVDKPDLFNGWQLPDLDPIPNFGVVKKALLKDLLSRPLCPWASAPPSWLLATAWTRPCEKLRAAYRPSITFPRRSGQAHVTPQEIASLKSHLRGMISVIQGDLAKLNVVAAKGTVDPREIEDIKKASSDAFGPLLTRTRWGTWNSSKTSSPTWCRTRTRFSCPMWARTWTPCPVL